MDLWDNTKSFNINVIGVLEGEAKQCGAKKYLKNIMAKGILGLVKHKNQ